MALSLSSSASAQGFRLSGRVLGVHGPDTVPAADQWVVMHQVTLGGGAAVDSVRTDRFGAYFLRAQERDTSALYLASTTHLGITYFSPPVRVIEFTADTAETLFVYDTSSVEPTLSLTERFVVVRSADADGFRSVLELLTIANTGSVTRVAGASNNPVWQAVLPAGATDLDVGDGDVSPDAILRVGDRIDLIAPVPPGEKQLVISYRLPGREPSLRVPVGQPTARLEVLLEDTTAVMTGGPLRRAGDEMMDAMRFARYEAADVAPGAVVIFEFSSPQINLPQYWWVLVVGAALAFALTIVFWWKRVSFRTVLDDPNVLAARIAALDESFEVNRDSTSADERLVYERSRSDLKARLTAALARRGPDA